MVTVKLSRLIRRGSVGSNPTHSTRKLEKLISGDRNPLSMWEEALSSHSHKISREKKLQEYDVMAILILILRVRMGVKRGFCGGRTHKHCLTSGHHYSSHFASGKFHIL